MTETLASEPAPPENPPPPSARPGLDAATAHLLSWMGIAAVNAVFIARLKVRAPADVRAFHHAYDAGQLIAAGVLAAGLVTLWGRFGPRSRVWPYVALALFATALAWGFVREDLASWAERLGAERWAPVILTAMTLGSGLAPPAAALIGRLVARPYLRWIGVVIGLAAAVANNLVLPQDYRGVHLFIAFGAAVLAGASLSGAQGPRFLGRALRTSRARRAGLGALAVLALLGAATIVVPPRPPVNAEMFRIDGVVVMPAIARVRSFLDRGAANVPPEAAEWYRDRSAVPPIPPSSPSLLPKDGIVLLITADSMRASLFADPKIRAKLPRMEQIRALSVDFTMARSPASRTLLTWGAVYTGQYYSGLKWTGVNIGKDRHVRFPTLLGKAGIPSVTFPPLGQLARGNLTGGFTEEITVKPRKGQNYPTSTEVMPRLIERIRQHKEGPLFLFTHLMDPHFPYDSATTRGTRWNRFVAEVVQVDKAVGQLWDALEAGGLLDRTTLIISADHGEAFGQHDTPYHTITLYEELIRVPLFVRIPGVRPRRVDQPVTLMDLGPTILDLYGQPTPGYWLGQSLVPFFRGEDPILTRPIAAQRSVESALLLGNRKVIVNVQKGTREIYDLVKDPAETHNLIEELGEEGEEQVRLLTTFFEAHALRR